MRDVLNIPKKGQVHWDNDLVQQVKNEVAALTFVPDVIHISSQRRMSNVMEALGIKEKHDQLGGQHGNIRHKKDYKYQTGSSDGHAIDFFLLDGPFEEEVLWYFLGKLERVLPKPVYACDLSLTIAGPNKETR